MQAARGASLTRDQHTRLGSPVRSRLWPTLGIALGAWLVDQGTKLLAVRELTGHEPVPVLGPLLRLNLTHNPGAAFSTGTSLTFAISVFAVVATVVVVVLATRVGTAVWAVALGLLLAGITGNLTDRLFREPGPMRGHVVDFLQLPHWPIFNVADICINVAAVLIVVQALRGVPMSGNADDPADRSGEGAAEGAGEP